MDDFMQGRELVEFWDDWLSKYHMQSLTNVQLARGAYVVRAVERLRLRQPDILDIGCAHGWLCVGLSKLGRVTGVDMSEKAIEAAHQLLPQGTFAAGDFVTMDFPDSSFDVITCLESIAYMDQPRFIQAVHRLLRPGGFLIVTTPNWPVWEAAGKRRGSPSTLEAHHLNMETLTALVQSRLSVVRTTTLNPLGLLRYLDTKKANAVLRRVVPEWLLADAKGLLGKSGRGSTLFVLAQKR